MNLQITIARFLLFAISTVATSGAEPADKGSKTVWTPPKYSKVIGYRFQLPSDNAKHPVPSGFTLLKKGAVDAVQLERFTIKSAELGQEHIQKLTAAVSAKRITYPAACYDPHHIFVFYSETGTVVAAIEICFSCTGVAAIPAIAEPQWYRHDYAALAKLTDELGLWLGPPTVKDWIAERDIPSKKP